MKGGRVIKSCYLLWRWRYVLLFPAVSMFLEAEKENGLQLKRKVRREQFHKVIAGHVFIHELPDQTPKARQHLTFGLLILSYIIFHHSSIPFHLIQVSIINIYKMKWRMKRLNYDDYRVEVGERREVEEGLEMGLVGRAKTGFPCAPQTAHHLLQRFLRLYARQFVQLLLQLQLHSSSTVVLHFQFFFFFTLQQQRVFSFLSVWDGLLRSPVSLLLNFQLEQNK